MSLNLYIYCEDNPMKLVDQNGHWGSYGRGGYSTSSSNPIDSWWNSLSPQTQSWIIVGVLAVATVACVDTCGVVTVPLEAAALTAAVGTAGSGSKANPTTTLEFAVTGFVGAGAGIALDSAALSGALGEGVASAIGNILGAGGSLVGSLIAASATGGAVMINPMSTYLDATAPSSADEAVGLLLQAGEVSLSTLASLTTPSYPVDDWSPSPSSTYVSYLSNYGGTLEKKM